MELLNTKNIDTEIEKIKFVKEHTKNFKYKFKKIRRKERLKQGSRQLMHYKKFDVEQRLEKKQLRKLRKASRLVQKRKVIIGVRKGKETSKYAEYIKSKEWEERKKKYYRTNKKICSKCKTFRFINLHHAVYGRFGNEKDEHLFPLCNTHHKDFHEKYGVKGNMLKETIEFIK